MRTGPFLVIRGAKIKSGDVTHALRGKYFLVCYRFEISTLSPQFLAKGEIAIDQLSSPIDLELSCVLKKHPELGRACPHGSNSSIY